MWTGVQLARWFKRSVARKVFWSNAQINIFCVHLRGDFRLKSLPEGAAEDEGDDSDKHSTKNSKLKKIRTKHNKRKHHSDEQNSSASDREAGKQRISRKKLKISDSSLEVTEIVPDSSEG
jgi:hypothetical protein